MYIENGGFNTFPLKVESNQMLDFQEFVVVTSRFFALYVMKKLVDEIK